MPSQKILRALAAAPALAVCVVCGSLASSCSSAPKKETSSATSNAGPAKPAASSSSSGAGGSGGSTNNAGVQTTGGEPAEPETPEATIQRLNRKVEVLESNLRITNDKLDSLRMSLDNFFNVQKPKPQGVISHPASRGAEVEAAPTEKDPEAAFARDGAVQSFRKAMILFQGQKFPDAVLAFSGFLEKYPDHPLAGNAQFYVGESYLKQKQYKLALEEFERVLTSYDRSSHVAETLKEMAEAESALQKKDEAAKHLQVLGSLFPNSPAASLAQASHSASGEAPMERSSTESKSEKPEKKEAVSPANIPANGANPAALDEPPTPTAPLEGK